MWQLLRFDLAGTVYQTYISSFSYVTSRFARLWNFILLVYFILSNETKDKLRDFLNSS